MTLRTRLEGGGTPRPEHWGIDSEYGRLTDVLVGPIDHFNWQAGNAVAQRSERVGRKFDAEVAAPPACRDDPGLRTGGRPRASVGRRPSICPTRCLRATAVS